MSGGESFVHVQVPIEPLVWFDLIELSEANVLLERWGHRMGPLRRPMNGDTCHVLVARGEGPVAVLIASTLIRESVGGGELGHLGRDSTIELSRLCAARPGLCRLAIRLWREFVLPSLAQVAISYQDADLHSGNTYRFDGWRRAGYSHSGKDTRSGRPGRNKWIWVWPPDAAESVPRGEGLALRG